MGGTADPPGRGTGPPKRVRVTSPRMGAPRRGPARPVTADIDEQTRLGELYMATLIRAQWRLAMSVLVPATMMIGGLPLLFLLVPATRSLNIGPIPLPWLILGVLIYPAIWLAGRYYVRQSEQIEREFTQLVSRR
ncbi:MAG: hypothetical protein QOE58_1726 [Actinomycetota bacterium]|nr:hypothetical protein [Actinomycetota bacterium]